MACTNRTPLSPRLSSFGEQVGASRVTAEVYGSLDQRGWVESRPLSSLGKQGARCDSHAAGAVRCMVSLFVPLTARGAVVDLGAAAATAT